MNDFLKSSKIRILLHVGENTKFRAKHFYFTLLKIHFQQEFLACVMLDENSIKKQICSKQILCGDTLDDKNALWEEIDSHVEPMKW